MSPVRTQRCEHVSPQCPAQLPRAPALSVGSVFSQRDRHKPRTVVQKLADKQPYSPCPAVGSLLPSSHVVSSSSSTASSRGHRCDQAALVRTLCFTPRGLARARRLSVLSVPVHSYTPCVCVCEYICVSTYKTIPKYVLLIQRCRPACVVHIYVCKVCWTNT